MNCVPSFPLMKQQVWSPLFADGSHLWLMVPDSWTPGLQALLPHQGSKQGCPGSLADESGAGEPAEW